MTLIERSADGRDVSLQCRNHVHTVRDCADSHLAHAFNCSRPARARVGQRLRVCLVASVVPRKMPGLEVIHTHCLTS